MKKILLTVAAGLSIIAANAQETNASQIGMTDEFKAMSKMGRYQTGFENIQTYSNSNTKGSQFFYPNWVPGSVVTANNETISGKYVFLYDRVRQELFIKPKDSNLVLLADKSQILSFTLIGDGSHLFVPDSKYKTAGSGINFFEALSLNDKGYSFLKFVSTKFVKANPNDLEKVRNGDLSDEFVDNTTYYLYSTATGLSKISMNEKSILKSIGAANQAAAKAFFEQHESDKVDETFVTGLVTSLNK